MTRERTPIDRLVERAVEKVARASSSAYFRKSEVINELRKQRGLGNALAQLKARYQEWKFDQVILRYIEQRVGQVLQMRDAHGLRIYENYAAGESERRWMILRAMTLKDFQSVVQETRVQERDLHVKGEGYDFFMKALKLLGPTARAEGGLRQGHSADFGVSR